MNIEELLSANAKSINNATNFWLVRTDGGLLFDTFYANDLIALGYGNISTKEIESTKSEGAINSKLLEEIVRKKYKDLPRPGFAVSQIRRFYSEISAGDIVVIPSFSSANLAIGEIIDDNVFTTDLYRRRGRSDVLVEDFHKCRKVRWLKTIKTSTINPQLFKLFFSHQTIVNAYSYRSHICGALYDFYRDDQGYHLVLDIEKERTSAFQLCNGMAELLEIAQEIAKLNLRCTLDLDDIEMKINLNSPGKLELIQKGGAILLVCGILLVGVNGGGFNVSVKSIGLNADLSTKGLLHQINEYMNSSADREVKMKLMSKIDKLEIKKPEEIRGLLNEINQVNQND